LANEPASLNEMEKKAADIERHLREEQRDWRKGLSLLSTNRFADRQQLRNNKPTPPTENIMKRNEMKTFVKA
jgi:hypothetical protein